MPAEWRVLTLPKIVISQVNTPEEIVGWLQLAQSLVEAANIRRELQEVALSKAIDLLAAKKAEVENTILDGV